MLPAAQLSRAGHAADPPPRIRDVFSKDDRLEMWEDGGKIRSPSANAPSGKNARRKTEAFLKKASVLPSRPACGRLLLFTLRVTLE